MRNIIIEAHSHPHSRFSPVNRLKSLPFVLFRTWALQGPPRGEVGLLLLSPLETRDINENSHEQSEKYIPDNFLLVGTGRFCLFFCFSTSARNRLLSST